MKSKLEDFNQMGLRKPSTKPPVPTPQSRFGTAHMRENSALQSRPIDLELLPPPVQGWRERRRRSKLQVVFEQHCPKAAVSGGCCNKTGGLRTTETCPLTVQEPEVCNQGVSRALLPRSVQVLLSASCSSGAHRHPAAVASALISASVPTLLSPLLTVFFSSVTTSAPPDSSL